MAKAQVAARFMTEVAPPQFVTIMRRRKLQQRSGALDTIAEDDRELQPLAYVGDEHQLVTAAASFTAATSSTTLKRASPAIARSGSGFMRELGSCFSSGNHVHGQAAAGAGSRESRRKNKGHGRRVVYAYQLHGNQADERTNY